MISKRIEMHLKYFEYMGLTSAKNMTHKEYLEIRQLLEDKDIHLNDWLMEQLGIDLSDKSRIAFGSGLTPKVRQF
jgi:hypothetical protein